MELATGRRSRLSVGDEVVVCTGAGCGADRRETYSQGVPEQWIIAAPGGLIAPAPDNGEAVGEATAMTLLGLVGGHAGDVLNLERYALPKMKPASPRQVILAVCGTAMDSGRSETVANLIDGLVRAGMRVGAAKVTGAAAGGDIWAAIDAGAGPVMDFTDVGLACTAGLPAGRVERAALDLLGYMSESDAQVIVLEFSDGLMCTENATLLASRRFARAIDGVVFAANDAAGAAAGVDWLKERQLNVSGISGLLTRSPLAVRELRALGDSPILDMDTLGEPACARALVGPFNVHSLSVA